MTLYYIARNVNKGLLQKICNELDMSSLSHSKFIKTISGLVIGMLFMTACATTASIPISYSPSIDVERFEQRKLYLDAIDLARNGQFTKLTKLKGKLKNYPLYPYVIYSEITHRISRQSPNDILNFIEQYSDTPLVQPLINHWLKNLAKRGQWETFLTYHERFKREGTLPINKDVACHYGFALYKNNLVEEAFRQAESLWLVGYSQPDSCDPIFQVWRNAGGITQENAWSRLTLSLKENERKLSSYLLRFIHKSDKTNAANFRLVHLKPKTIKRYKSFTQDNQRNREIILHGAIRLARTDPVDALAALRHYASIYAFDQENLEYTYARIGIYLAGRSDTANMVDGLPINLNNHPALVEARIRQNLREDNLSDVLILIALLPDDLQSSSRYKYWKGRVLASSLDSADREVAHRIFHELATERSFYGFLSADLMNLDYSFEEESVQISRDEMLSFEESPGIQRALELLALEERSRARREWYFSTSDLTLVERKIAASVALRWGWHKAAIQTMIEANAWNYLDYRFPLAFQENFISHARRTNIPVEWSLAVSRQESAFMPDAKSSAGALGVMQLMPATARLVANKTGTRYRSTSELTKVNLNIQLGTHYLAQMLRRYQNNRILASAAYNAGPGRVDRWLNPDLSVDVWIESIPFRETRNYVQNVLMFSVIYARQMGEFKPLIYDQERDYFSQRQLKIPVESLTYDS